MNSTSPEPLPLTVACFGCSRVRIAGVFVVKEGVDVHSDDVSSTICPECAMRLYSVSLPESVHEAA